MSKKTISRQASFPYGTVILCLLWAGAALVFFSGYYKVLTLLAGLAGLYLLARRDLSPLRTLPALLLMAYVVFSGLTGIWAISGKFFLQGFSKIFTACALFLAVLLSRDFGRASARRVMAVLSGASAIFAALSVEAASTGLTRTLLPLVIPSMASTDMGFESGTRLTGILGNANISSSILALGIFFALALLCTEETPRGRDLYAGLAALNAFVFLLSFSMGGTACFAAAVVVYLVFAGRQRVSVFLRMLECAVPTLLWVFVAFPFFNREGAAAAVPLLAMVGDVATVILLERFLYPRLSALLERREKLAMGVLAGVVVLAAAYLLLGYNLSGAYTFGGSLERSAYPQAGTHTLSVQATGDVSVKIISQNMSQVMMHTNTVLYEGDAQGAEFTVPEDSKVCYFTFSAGEGTTLSQASIDASQPLKLKYTLLPGFIANRLQGLWANQNAIQRTVFFQDGMKMFYNKPLTGNGVGSFSTGITSVQDFYYETNYVHNHYIQVLLESGLVGFVAFVGAMAGLVWLLWRRRKEGEDWAFQGLYPALWAALAMTLLHALVEVSLSTFIFLAYAYMTFALIIRCCAPQEEAQPAGKKGRRPRQSRQQLAFRLVCLVFPAAFLVTLCMNLAAYQISHSAVSSAAEFLNHLKVSASLDLYEGNDAKLSYVEFVRVQGDEAHRDQADQYAQELMQAQSNSIPKTLVAYYLDTAQYQMAIQAAKLGAVYSASDPDTWNDVLSIFDQALFGILYSPLLDEPDVLLDGLMEYFQLLEDHNQASMEDIQLTQANQEFMEKIQELAAGDRSTGTILAMIGG